MKHSREEFRPNSSEGAEKSGELVAIYTPDYEFVSFTRPRFIFRLSRREKEVLACISEGLTNHEIAEQLDISPETIKTYVARIFKKLMARNRTEAVRRAIELGLC